jgi:hypothetical protein
MWKQCLSFALTTERTSAAGHTLLRLRWSGRLELRSGETCWELSFDGTRETGTHTIMGSRVDQIIEDISVGIPFCESTVLQKRFLIEQLATSLGTTQDVAAGLSRVVDGRVARVVLLLLQSLPTEVVATECGESLAFVQRVYSVHFGAKLSQKMYFRPTVRHADLLGVNVYASGGAIATHHAKELLGISSSQRIGEALQNSDDFHNWAIDQSTLRMKECTYCRSTARAWLALPEPVGRVCLDCRHDESGLVWPAKPYDGFVRAWPDWEVAGVCLAVGPFGPNQKSHNGSGYNGATERQLRRLESLNSRTPRK